MPALTHGEPITAKCAIRWVATQMWCDVVLFGCPAIETYFSPKSVKSHPKLEHNIRVMLSYNGDSLQ